MKKLSYLFVIISFFYFSNTSFSTTTQNKDTFITKLKNNQSDAISQSNLGSMYEIGQGVPQDYLKAAELFSKAANQGLPEAQFNLGNMYAHGRGVPQD
ncbi:tetratricopeptide repeat protein, partial [Acetobacter thailandicus]|uniref:tetratricopeptide repeat protein n=1 Tax=Acetobacter thailandicus TaxID=1502842 RepID=UPI001BABE985